MFRSDFDGAIHREIVSGETEQIANAEGISRHDPGVKIVVSMNGFLGRLPGYHLEGINGQINFSLGKAAPT